MGSKDYVDKILNVLAESRMGALARGWTVNATNGMRLMLYCTQQTLKRHQIGHE